MRLSVIAALCLVLAVPVAAAAQERPGVLLLRGERYLAMGKIEAAMQNYNKVLACCAGTPEAAEAHNDLGVCHARQGNRDKAEAEYRKSLAINGYPLAAFNLGKLRSEDFTASGDAAARAEAVALLTRFGDYLARGDGLPPVVSYNRAEIDVWLAETLSGLEVPATGE